MYEKVRAYIRENDMIKEGDVVLAGVSGGGDSMAMLHLLVQYQKECSFFLQVVHVHHGIRGEEADRDQQQVEKICALWKVKCSVYAYDVPKLSAKWKLGTEETGRMVRKEAFRKESLFWEQEGRRVKIALAHTQGDLAETMLHHLARGTGLRGLSSMRPVAEPVIRPILCLNHEEIVNYLKGKEIPYLLDSTNLSDDYTRNRIRHHILPMLEREVNPKAAAHMAETARVVCEAEAYLRTQGEELLAACPGEQERYLFLHSFFEAAPIVQTYAVGLALEKLAGRRKDFTSVHIRKILELEKKQTGRQVALPYGICAEKSYQGVRLWQKGSENAEQETVSGRQEWAILPPGELKCSLGTFYFKIFFYEGQKIEEKKCTKWLDYDKIVGNPCVRTRRTGDYLIVDGRGSRKKLNRCMIDDKIPQKLRDSVALVTCGEEVLWIAGGRMNEKYKITPNTRRVLELQYQGGDCHE